MRPQKHNKIDKIFQESCESFYEMVLKYCFCMLNNIEDAKDCTQETFKYYYEDLISGKSIQSHPAYILKIARNICAAKVKQIERYNKYIRSSLTQQQVYNQLSIEQQFDNAQIDGKIDVIASHIIDSLDATEKSLYYNYFINTMNATQIAKAVHESPTSIQKKVKKLKSKIKKLVKEAVILEGGGRK